ncbi:MAG: hypothetical protein HYV59_09575 [Planctomycetes bacterium]|nr:hypothetical protein [Planctomycetota bacterium]
MSDIILAYERKNTQFHQRIQTDDKTTNRPNTASPSRHNKKRLLLQRGETKNTPAKIHFLTKPYIYLFFIYNKPLAPLFVQGQKRKHLLIIYNSPHSKYKIINMNKFKMQELFKDL